MLVKASSELLLMGNVEIKNNKFLYYRNRKGKTDC